MTKATTKQPTTKSKKVTTKATRKKQQTGRTSRVTGIVLAVVVAAAIGAGGLYLYRKQSAGVVGGGHSADVINPDDTESARIFRSYLVKLAETRVSNQEASSGQVGTQSTTSAKMVYDATNQRVNVLMDMECSDTRGGGDKTFNATVQMDNHGAYLRINSVSGTNTNSAGRVTNLNSVYAKAKGKWYAMSGSNSNIQAQLDKRVFIFATGLMAPGRDAQKIADALVDARAFDYSVVAQDDGTYKINLATNKNNYILALKKALPDMPEADTILDSSMGDSESGEFNKTLVIKKDGSLVSIQSPVADECTTLLYNYVAPGPANRGRSGGMLTQDFHIRPAGSIKIMPVQGAVPISNLDKDAVW